MIKGPEGGLLRFLSNGELCRIHETSLKVLEDVGITTDSDVILKSFSEAGASVDKAAKKIKIPRSFIEASLKTVPRSIVLYGRNPEKDLLVEGTRVYFGLGGSPTPQFRDVETGNVRTPTKEDVIKATLLGDALPHISFVMSLAGAYDSPPERHYLHEYDRQSEQVWSEAGRKKIDEVAREKVHQILSEHRPEPILDSAKEEIIRILKEASEEFGNS